jgi:hypothetical protein
MVNPLSLSVWGAMVPLTLDERQEMDHDRILNEYVHAADQMIELFGKGLKGPVSIKVFNNQRINEIYKTVAVIRSLKVQNYSVPFGLIQKN